MQKKWSTVSDIPDQGREYYFEDEQDWAGLKDSNLSNQNECDNLKVMVEVLPQKDGIYFKGNIKGQTIIPCSRCLEASIIDIYYEFDLFEDFEKCHKDRSETGLLKFENGQWHINLQRLVQEQALLALPDKPLCSEICKGLCPKCGEDLNRDLCSCSENTGDPRMAVFQKVKIKK